MRNSLFYKIYISEPLAHWPRITKLSWIVGAGLILQLYSSLPILFIPSDAAACDVHDINGKLIYAGKSGRGGTNTVFGICSDQQCKKFVVGWLARPIEELLASKGDVATASWCAGFRASILGPYMPLSLSIGGREFYPSSWGKEAYSSQGRFYRPLGFVGLGALAYLILFPWILRFVVRRDGK